MYVYALLCRYTLWCVAQESTGYHCRGLFPAGSVLGGWEGILGGAKPLLDQALRVPAPPPSIRICKRVPKSDTISLMGTRSNTARHEGLTQAWVGPGEVATYSGLSAKRHCAYQRRALTHASREEAERAAQPTVRIAERPQDAKGRNRVYREASREAAQYGGSDARSIKTQSTDARATWARDSFGRTLTSREFRNWDRANAKRRAELAVLFRA